MKAIIIFLLAFTILTFAQDKQTKTDSVSSEMKEYVNKIYSDKPAVKMLITKILKDQNYRKEIHQALVNDPETKVLIQEMRKENKEMWDNEIGMMNDKGMMNKKNMMNDKDKDKMKDKMKDHSNMNKKQQDTTMNKKK